MEITHLPEDNLFKTVVDGYTAYVTYIIRDGKLDIRHTIVPPEIGGRGIAAQLVKATYDYALKHHLQPIATCSYAVVWLQRHPEYQGHLQKLPVRVFQSGKGIHIYHGDHDQKGRKDRQVMGTDPDKGKDDKGGHGDRFD